jgi:hypothetical protein
MDAEWFDQTVSSLTTSTSRRSTVLGLLGGIIAGIVPNAGPGAARRKSKKKSQIRRKGDRTSVHAAKKEGPRQIAGCPVDKFEECLAPSIPSYLSLIEPCLADCPDAESAESAECQACFQPAIDHYAAAWYACLNQVCRSLPTSPLVTEAATRKRSKRRSDVGVEARACDPQGLRDCANDRLAELGACALGATWACAGECATVLGCAACPAGIIVCGGLGLYGAYACMRDNATGCGPRPPYPPPTGTISPPPPPPPPGDGTSCTCQFEYEVGCCNSLCCDMNDGYFVCASCTEDRQGNVCCYKPRLELDGVCEPYLGGGAFRCVTDPRG